MVINDRFFYSVGEKCCYILGKIENCHSKFACLRIKQNIEKLQFNTHNWINDALKQFNLTDILLDKVILLYTNYVREIALGNKDFYINMMLKVRQIREYSLMD